MRGRSQWMWMALAGMMLAVGLQRWLADSAPEEASPAPEASPVVPRARPQLEPFNLPEPAPAPAEVRAPEPPAAEAPARPAPSLSFEAAPLEAPEAAPSGSSGGARVPAQESLVDDELDREARRLAESAARELLIRAGQPVPPLDAGRP